MRSVPDFVEYSEIASESNGGKILFATDDFFATAENLLKDSDPIFIVGKFGKFGKWMDGWETRRKRIPGHDWCIIKLGASCYIRGINVDTAHFTGNYAPKISIQAANLNETEIKQIEYQKRTSKLGSACTKEELSSISVLKTDKWTEIVPLREMQSGYEATRMNYIEIKSDEIYTHIRLNIYPDGGVARLRVYGDVQLNLKPFLNNKIADLLAFQSGAKCLSYSNAHYGHPRNLIKPGKSVNMGDGWETARRLDRPPVLKTNSYGILDVPGEEWAIFRLCCLGSIDNIIVDTKHFKGNFPDSIRIEGANLDEDEGATNAKWSTLLKSHKLSQDQEHFYDSKSLISTGPFNHLKVIMAPDGGISRIRVFGKPIDIDH